MAKKERFGKFVLLEELGFSSLGCEHRAAKLAAGGALERLVLLIQLAPALSANKAFTDALLEQAKAASLLHGPNILKLIAIGRVEIVYYLAYEHVEGKSLRSVVERSRRDAFPLTPDHALVIASKVSAALDYAHGKQGQLGGHVHGWLTPDAVLVTHDGQVKLRGFGVWAAGAAEAGAVAADEYRYLAPEQVTSRAADAQSDVFGVGALLFEMLTGQPLADGDPAACVKQARLAGGVEGEPLPEPMAEILSRALAKEPAKRFAEMAEMRKTIDALLHSGEFNPTTFNLAFFMHSLFRREIEKEARSLAEERAASYAQYWVEDARAQPEQQPAPREEAAHIRIPEGEPKSSAPLPVIAAALVILGGAAGWYFVAGPGARGASPPPSTVSAETVAAQARVKELEEKLKRFEQEKAGSLVSVNEIGVIPPSIEQQAPLEYPPLARQQRVEGSVELSVLVDDKGRVVEAKVVKGAPGVGLNQAAIDNVKRRKYRPATKDGVPVMVYVPVIVRFEIPR